MKKTVAVVVVVALIVAAFAILPLPYVKAQASQAKVLTYSWFIDNSTNPVLAQNQGDLVVVGDVENVGSSIIQNITVSGTAYNSTGQAVASAEGVAYSYEMTPGQKVPFSIDFTPASSTTANSNYMSSVTSITVSVLSVTDTSTSPYTDLTLPHGSYDLNVNGTYTVVGTIVNNGTETMDYVWVVTTFYNSGGTVVGLNYTYVVTPSAVLAPGNPSMWVATPEDNSAQLTNEIASYSYVIDSLPLGTSSQSQPTPTPPASTAPSQLPVLPIIVVVVVVAAAAAALMLLRKRQKLPPPPPPPPME